MEEQTCFCGKHHEGKKVEEEKTGDKKIINVTMDGSVITLDEKPNISVATFLYSIKVRVYKLSQTPEE